MRYVDYAIEGAASLFTLAGMYAGSTTALGAWLYLVSLIFWFLLTYRKKVWGIMPLNCASLALTSYNLCKALNWSIA